MPPAGTTLLDLDVWGDGYSYPSLTALMFTIPFSLLVLSRINTTAATYTKQIQQAP